MRFALCTSVYESGRPYLDDWISAAIAAAEGHDVLCVVAVDKLQDPEKALARLIDTLPVVLEHAPDQASPATVRATMLTAAVASNADALVFCDMDDRLRPDALTCHQGLLQTADFTFGDLQLIDQSGVAINGTFFEGSAIPNQIYRIESIIDRNWLGFSNTAVRKNRVPKEALEVPSDIVAVDWWFYTKLLKAGLKGARVDSVMADYRMHDANEVGCRPTRDAESLKHRCHIVKRHYESFPSDIIAAQRLRLVDNLLEKLETNADVLSAAITRACDVARVWYEDISHLTTYSHAGAATKVQLPNYSAPTEFTTRANIYADLKRLGIAEGDTVMPHVSVSSLDFVIGGLRSVLDALYDAVGDSGTLLMPAFTGDLTDPATWFKPPVPEKDWPAIRDAMPAFNPERTPSKGIGALAELFRTETGTSRSSHPVSSFCARGPNAKRLLFNHALNSRFGKDSPLGEFCKLAGKVVLIGSPYESMTLLHMTTYELEDGLIADQQSPILVDENKAWVSYQDRSLSWQWFAGAVENLIEKGIARVGTVSNARTLVVDAGSAVAETITWRKENKV
jgi:aminoglycoside 3-N-acetyltransferase